MDNQFGQNMGIGIGRLTGATVSDTINNINSFQESVNNKYDAQKTQEIENSAMSMYESGMKATDQNIKNESLSGANTAFMELIIKKAAQAAGSTGYDNLGPGEVIQRYMKNNPEQLQNTAMAQKGEMKIGVWARYNGLEDFVNPARQEYLSSMQDVTPQENTKKKGKSWVGRTAKGLGIGAGLELLGFPIERGGERLEDRTWDRTQGDIAREKKRTVNKDLREEFPQMLEDVESEILEKELAGVADEDLQLLYQQRESLRKAIKEVENLGDKLPSNKPRSTKEYAKQLNLWGNDERVSQNLGKQSRIKYVTEIEPVVNASKSTHNIPEIIESAADDLLLDKEALTSAKKELKKITKAYKGDKSASLADVYEAAKRFRLSKKIIEGENPNSYQAVLRDKIHTRLQNTVKEQLEKEYPGQGFSQKLDDLHQIMELEDEAEGYAEAAGKRKAGKGSAQGLNAKGELKKGTVGKVSRQRNIGKGAQNLGKRQRATYWIKKAIDLVKNRRKELENAGKEIYKNISAPEVKSEEVVTQEAPNVTNKVSTKAKKKSINPKSMSQPSLLGSPEDWITVALKDEMERGGLEIPLDVLTDVVSYALETNKLNSEGNRDLPLVNYENQSPYKGLPRNSLENEAKYRELHPERQEMIRKNAEWMWKVMNKAGKISDEEYNLLESIGFDEALYSEIKKRIEEGEDSELEQMIDSLE